VKSRSGVGILKGLSQTVYFATTNRGKFIEAAQVALRFGIKLKHLRIEKLEIQSNDLTAIASFAALEAARSMRRVVVSEDAGFFVNALGGFPGPYSSYVFKTLGTSGILRLMENGINREASFQAAVAFCTPKTRARCFTGVVDGLVSKRPRGTNGFGFDPIFIPRQGDGRTFAEMTTEEKNALSHRAVAFAKFSKWFIAKRTRFSG
jgi:XTP/dITP diphosphohydrolase